MPSAGPFPSPALPASFAFSYGRFNLVLMTVLGLGPSRSRFIVGEATVAVHFGWGFWATIDRSAIVGVEPYDGRVYGWGAHGWAGRWLVNGSSKGILRLTIEPRGRGRVMGVPVTLRELRVSLEDPDAVAALLAPERRA